MNDKPNLQYQFLYFKNAFEEYSCSEEIWNRLDDYEQYEIFVKCFTKLLDKVGDASYSDFCKFVFMVDPKDTLNYSYDKVISYQEIQRRFDILQKFIKNAAFS